METVSGSGVESEPPAAHPRESVRRLLKVGTLVTLVLAATAAHYYLGDQRLEQTGPLVTLDRVFDISLALYLLALAAAIGWKVSSLASFPYATSQEKLLFSTALGVGVISYLVLAVGLVGLLSVWVIAPLLILLSILLRHELATVLREGVVAIGGSIRLLRLVAPSGESSLVRLARAAVHAILAMAAFLLLLVLLRSLMPPFDYDGLMYHLAVPKVYVEQGRIFPITQPLQAAFPFLVEMLYTIGLVFRSDGAAAILEVFFLVLTCLALYSAARRWFDGTIGPLAVLLYLSNNLVLVLASQTYVDTAFAYFEFLGLYAFLVWAQQKERSWLLLSAALTGLAMAIKYQGLQTLLAMNLFILGMAAFKITSESYSGVRAWRALVPFNLVALSVASPWYIKNFLWLGNPVYPLFFSGLDWNQARQRGLELLLSNYGLGHSPLDILLLPWNILVQSQHFVQLIPPPYPFYLLLPLALLFGRGQPVLGYLLTFSGLRFVIWAMQYQELRLLVPIFPALTLAAAYGMAQLSQWGRYWLKPLAGAPLLLPIFVLTLTTQVLSTMMPFTPQGLSPEPLKVMLPVALGIEPRSKYLLTLSDSYGAVGYLNAVMSPSEKALFLWDGKWYYMKGQTIVDDVNYGFSYFESLYDSQEEIMADWQRRGVTYVTVNRNILAIMEMEGHPLRHSAIAFDDFQRRYLELVYEDRVRVYKVRGE